MPIDRYAVVGNPVAHSLSPRIHAAFAAQTGQEMEYTTLLAPLDRFWHTVWLFMAGGGKGVNVTVPFKEEAFLQVLHPSDRARDARAVNTIQPCNFDGFEGDNTDGVGLVRDLTQNLAWTLRGARILLLGAGGAARGVFDPLLDEQPGELVLANRTPERAIELVAERLSDRASGPGQRLGAPVGQARGCGFPDLAGQSFDLVINATSASLANAMPPLPDGLLHPGCRVYDMMYGRETPFLVAARAAGAEVADGLGMLVEQAAEAFRFWRGVMPDSAPVLAMLRSGA